MKEKLMLRETSELWRKMEEAGDVQKFQVERRQLLKDIEKAEEQLKKVSSMEEYQTVSQDIKDLQAKITELEIKLRIQPKVSEEIFREEGAKVKDTYNREFRPYYDEYLKQKKQFEKELLGFAKSIEPIVNKMIEIEKLEQSFHMLKNKQYVADRSEFIKLPVDTATLDRAYSIFNPVHYNSSKSIKKIITAIKRNWGEK
ncbi:hypothetical protein [Sporosarcina sp. FSL K6-3457]|uniref:hypothetical protein n=1 Tax=Sporosarcina sp. FSL K6-3457 TaxID=2978204 RepID=UPI0030FD179D